MLKFLILTNMPITNTKHIYMKWFDFENDCGQSYRIQQIIMQICIV
jgi:hypothetical protein